MEPEDKLEPNTEDLLEFEDHQEIENLHESFNIKDEPTLPPGTPTHSTTLDNITSQLDQVTPESSKTQLQFDFQREVYVKRELKDNQCTVCSKVFSTKQNLQLHLLIHADKRANKCDRCGKCFKSRGYLNLHKQIHNRPAFVCADCNKTFTWKSSLAQHIKHRHLCESDRIRYPCSICSKSYSYNKDLTAHLKTHNLQHCEICNLECAGFTALRTHLKVAHLGEEKLRCKTCGKYFITLEVLTTHEEVHKNTFKFKCSICGQRFLRSDILERHVKKHHSVLYDCIICYKSFTSKQNLSEHESAHTKPERSDNSEKVYSLKHIVGSHVSNCLASDEMLLRTCYMCYNVFNSVDKLKEHYSKQCCAPHGNK